MRSGKNQLSQFLRKLFESKGLIVDEDMFAKGVKDGCRKDFKPLVDALDNVADNLELYFGEGNVPTSLRIKEDHWYENKTSVTRALLQVYGTEIFRNRVDGNWWVKQLKQRIVESSANVILVTDVRFPNEIEGLFPHDEEYRLVTLRVNRNVTHSAPGQDHASELALDNYNQFDYIIDNTGSLNDLEAAAETIMSDITTLLEETV